MYFPSNDNEATTELPFVGTPTSQWTNGMKQIWAERFKEQLAENRAKLRELILRVKMQAAHERAPQPLSEEEEFRRFWATATPAERAAIEAEAQALEQHARVRLQFDFARAMGMRHAQDQAAAERRRKAAQSLPIPAGAQRQSTVRPATRPGMTLTRHGFPYLHPAILPTHLT
jgi:hypothetical protein